MSKLIKLTIEVRVLDEQKLRRAAEETYAMLGLKEDDDRTVTGDLIMATVLCPFLDGALEECGIDVENENAEIVEEEDD